MNIEKEKEQETLKYLSAMEIIDFNKLGFVYGKEAITDTLVLLKNKDIEIEMLKKDNKKKDKIIDEMAHSIANDNELNYEVCENVYANDSVECDHLLRKQCEQCIKQYFTKKVEDK